MISVFELFAIFLTFIFIVLFYTVPIVFCYKLYKKVKETNELVKAINNKLNDSLILK